VALATKELAQLGLVQPDQIERGFVVRMPKAYPFYDKAYHANIDTIRTWIADEVPNVHPVGRNGMHRYNNQDHSMLTAILSVQNIRRARSTTCGRSTWRTTTTRSRPAGSTTAATPPSTRTRTTPSPPTLGRA
jgi:hypothetical protein